MTARAPSPEDLLASVSGRPEDALGMLYDRYAARLLGMLSQILPDRRAAEQALEEVFLKVRAESRRCVRARVSLAAWLFVAARHAAVNRLRAARRLPALTRGNPDPLQKSLDWLPAPKEIAKLDERRELLKKVINQLPKPQWQVLELAVFEGYTSSEIAERLGEPLGRVNSELRAAMRFLRHRLRAVMGIWAANI